MTELSVVITVVIAFCLGTAFGTWCAMHFFKWHFDSILEEIHQKWLQELQKNGEDILARK